MNNSAGMFETCHCCDEFVTDFDFMLAGWLHCRGCAVRLVQKALDYTARGGKEMTLSVEFEELRPDLIFPDPTAERPDWTKAWEGVI